jgi:hypothetical protein
MEDTQKREGEMTKLNDVVPVSTNNSGYDSINKIYKSVPAGNLTFKPVKPENLVRPQGIKPPPPGRTK